MKNISIKLLVLLAIAVIAFSACNPIDVPKFMKVKVRADYVRDLGVSGCPVVDASGKVLMGVEDLARTMDKLAEGAYVIYDLEVRVGFPPEEYNGGYVKIGVGDRVFGEGCRGRAHLIAFNGVGIGTEWIHIDSDGTKYLLIRFDINGYPHPE